eukprot:2345220-Amphidinium_carterae.1
MRLIRGDFLVKLDELQEKVRRHQDLPEEAFMRFEELQESDVELVAISYCWCSNGHPDPNRFHLALIARMIKAKMAGEYVHSQEDVKRLGVAGYLFGASKVAVLWDFMSLPQKERTESERAAFQRGLACMHAWYGSKHVSKWILPDLPAGAHRATYHSSGWARFERELANLISPPWRMLTLARGTEAHEKLYKRREFKKFDFIRISYAAAQAGERKGPMDPDEFAT